jgi:hypothetical protein
MKTIFILSIFVISGLYSFAQKIEDKTQSDFNLTDKLLNSDGKLTIGGYGEVHYNQPLDAKVSKNGTLDVHRMVLLIGYNFNSKVQFISEFEFEHVSEVYVEQAFMQYKLNPWINLRAGLMLIPMGIINEFHEPTTFNGVERPFIDTKISPSTWREIGIGISGNILPASMKYQLYIVNGFNGYDGTAKLNGSSGFRNGRQKGAESYISSPNLTGKIDYYGIKGLTVGLSYYVGKTQSKLYNGLDKEDDASLAAADSSVVGLSMIGLDGRYTIKGFTLKGQYYINSISNSLQYNYFTASDAGIPNDLGSAMNGLYIEAGYDVLRFINKTDMNLIPFIRFETYNTQSAVEATIMQNKANKVTAITTGLTLKLSKGAVVKTDVQFIKPANTSTYSKIINAGIGIMF